MRVPWRWLLAYRSIRGHLQQVPLLGRHRRVTNRKVESGEHGGRWNVAQVLEAALLSLAGDIFRQLPGMVFKVMEDAEEDLTKAAETIDKADAKLGEEAKQTGRPSILPVPVTTASPQGRFLSMSKSCVRWRTKVSSSSKVPGSSSFSTRSRAVILPFA